MVKEEDGTVTTKAAERLGLYYSDLIPVIIKGMQEQQDTIDSLERENDELRKVIEQLALRVDALEGQN